MNSVVIAGRIGKMELRTGETKDKDAYSLCDFSVAVSDRHDETTWFNCRAWNGTAEVITKYFEKGDQIIIKGQMLCNQYKDKDGNARSWWFINVDGFDFGAKAKRNNDESEEAEQPDEKLSNTKKTGYKAWKNKQK